MLLLRETCCLTGLFQCYYCSSDQLPLPLKPHILFDGRFPDKAALAVAPLIIILYLFIICVSYLDMDIDSRIHSRFEYPLQKSDQMPIFSGSDVLSEQTYNSLKHDHS